MTREISMQVGWENSDSEPGTERAETDYGENAEAIPMHPPADNYSLVLPPPPSGPQSIQTRPFSPKIPYSCLLNSSDQKKKKEISLIDPHTHLRVFFRMPAFFCQWSRSILPSRPFPRHDGSRKTPLPPPPSPFQALFSKQDSHRLLASMRR